ncbi:exosome complex RNA-binding protein Csl4 [mine drainage metagenome]|uniref:Exosome complex RNA-binding protein Csl4 n=2 Tax=mine drainage metagenome TaxID=410659 RepID=T0Y7Q2_9ZZZZ
MTIKNEGKLVFPGDNIGNVEEYLPGDNVTEESGELIALNVGSVSEDHRDLRVSVHTAKKKLVPRPEDIVYGQIIKGDRGRFTVAIGAFKPRHSKEIYPTKLESTLKIESRRDEVSSPVRVGDYIRGKLFLSRYGMDLSISGPNLGVLLAKCQRCRQELVLENGTLKCKNCDLTEHRKIAEDYGKIDLHGKEF